MDSLPAHTNSSVYCVVKTGSKRWMCLLLNRTGLLWIHNKNAQIQMAVLYGKTG